MTHTLDLISATQPADSGELRLFFSFALQKSFLARKRKSRICVHRAGFQQNQELTEKCVFSSFSFSLSISLISSAFPWFSPTSP